MVPLLPLRTMFYVWLVILVVETLLISGGNPANLARNIALLSTKVRGAVTTQAYVFLGLSVLMIQGSVTVLTAFEQSRRNRDKIFLLATCTLITAAVCFACGSRSRALTTFLVPCFYIAWRSRRRLAYLWPVAIVAVGAAVVGVVFLGQMVRYASQTHRSLDTASPLETFITSFSLLDPMCMVLGLRDSIPQDWLQSIATLVIWLLPSAWVAKSMIGPLVLRHYYYGDYLGGVTLGMFGEYYFYFGYAGLVLLSFLSGWFLRHFGSVARRKDIYGRLVFTMLVYFSFVAIRDGFFVDMLDLILAALYLLVWRSSREIVASARNRQKNAQRRMGRGTSSPLAPKPSAHG
jgi:oligosaccharide repeat unit polymerase